MISVQNLRKKYGEQIALNGIDFSIRKGEFYGLLGPNGAGKTTTIGIISTILEPDEGSVTINDLPLKDNKIACKRMIGVVPQEIALYDKLTAKQNLFFWGSLYGIDNDTLTKRIDETLQLLGLADRANDKVSTYSGGMKRRINIASALLHRPEILFMDEPTVGIDPQSRNLIFEVVEKLHKEGMTIVYTTHYMEEAERFCDRIGIIDKGSIVAQGTLTELLETSKLQETIVFSAANLTDELIAKIKSEIMEDVLVEKDVIRFPVDNVKTRLPQLVNQCSAVGLEISQIEIQKINLESIFLKLTGKQLRD
jgi:ABC-2 type transport system ATP-binding protein